MVLADSLNVISLPRLERGEESVWDGVHPVMVTLVFGTPIESRTVHPSFCVHLKVCSWGKSKILKLDNLFFQQATLFEKHHQSASFGHSSPSDYIFWPLLCF